MSFVLGVDGGGTKTDLLLAGPGGRRGARVAGTSLARRPAAEVRAELAKGWAALGMAPLATVDAVCAGFASAGAHREAYEALLRAMFPEARLRVLTDAEVAREGAFGRRDGIVIIAGTGSIAWGRYGGRTARAGGLHPGCDPGSGDWIAATGATPQQTAAELVRLLEDCAGQLAWPQPKAAYVGGVFESCPAVLGALRKLWHYPLRAPRASPVEGALGLAREMLAC